MVMSYFGKLGGSGATCFLFLYFFITKDISVYKSSSVTFAAWVHLQSRCTEAEAAQGELASCAWPCMSLVAASVDDSPELEDIWCFERWQQPLAFTCFNQCLVLT